MMGCVVGRIGEQPCGVLVHVCGLLVTLTAKQRPVRGNQKNRMDDSEESLSHSRSAEPFPCLVQFLTAGSSGTRDGVLSSTESFRSEQKENPTSTQVHHTVITTRASSTQSKPRQPSGPSIRNEHSQATSPTDHVHSTTISPRDVVIPTTSIIVRPPPPSTLP